MLFKIRQFLISKLNLSVYCEKIEVEYNYHLRSYIVKNPSRNYIYSLSDFVTSPSKYIDLMRCDVITKNGSSRIQNRFDVETENDSYRNQDRPFSKAHF